MADGCRWRHTTGVRRRGWWGFEEQAPYLELAETKLRSSGAQHPGSSLCSKPHSWMPSTRSGYPFSRDSTGLGGDPDRPGSAKHGRQDPLERRIRLPRSSTSAAQPEDSGGDARRPDRLRGHATNRNHRPYCRRSVMRSVLGEVAAWKTRRRCSCRAATSGHHRVRTPGSAPEMRHRPRGHAGTDAQPAGRSDEFRVAHYSRADARECRDFLLQWRVGSAAKEGRK